MQDSMQELQNQFQNLNTQQQTARNPRHKRPAHAYFTDLQQPSAPPSQPQYPELDPKLARAQAAPQQATSPYVRQDLAAKQIPDLPEIREANQALWRTNPFCTWDHR